MLDSIYNNGYILVRKDRIFEKLLVVYDFL